MTETPVTNQGDFGSAATVAVLAAPATGEHRLMFELSLYNDGSTDRTWKLARKKAGTSNFCKGGTLIPGGTAPMFESRLLGADDESFEVTLSTTDSNVHFTMSAINRAP